MRRNGAAFLWVIMAAVVFAAFTYAPFAVRQVSYQRTVGKMQAYTESINDLAGRDTLSPLFHALAETATPAVVVVATAERVAYQTPSEPNASDFLRWFFGEETEQPSPGTSTKPKYMYRYGLGSGIIVDAEKGYILTNWHVVENAEKVIVLLPDQREVKSEWVRSDPRTDLAVIKIGADRLFALPLGDSTKTGVGDLVLAIGAPQGLEHTVTAGIISAKGRVISDGYETFLQTDAAINPGNSGGPLVNMRGEAIGINTSIVSSAGGNEGIGLAIPSNTAKFVMQQLIEKGEVVRGYLGVQVTDVDTRIAGELKLPSAEGSVIVKVVPHSPAAQAGLEPKDTIVALDGQKVNNSNDLQRIASALPPGKKVPVEIYRDGKKESIEVTIGTLPPPKEQKRKS